MHSVTVDAGVLAVPPLDCHRNEVYQYLEMLLDVERLRKEEWVRLSMSQWAADVLANDEVYPDRSALKSLFAAKGIIEYDANTYVRITDSLLTDTPTLEEHFQVQYVLMDEVRTDPDLVTATAGQETASDLERCLVLLALLRTYCTHPVWNHTFILRSDAPSGEVLIHALIQEVEHQRDDIVPFPMAPDTFDGTVTVCNSFRDLIARTDSSSAWTIAGNDDEKVAVVRVALYQACLNLGDQPDWEDMPAFRFGRDFLKRATRVCADTGNALVPRMLRSMVESLLRQKMDDVHALRKGKKGGAPQRMRGADKAWRRDVDRDYHLHYWECEKGLIEFGWVGPHNDDHLPE